MPATPFKVKAVYEYKSAEPDDLNFPNGQIITVTEEEDDDWYSGEYVNTAGEKVHGIFPRNFVEKYEPAIPSRPTRAAKKLAQPEAQESEPSTASVASAPTAAAPTTGAQAPEPVPPAKNDPPEPQSEEVAEDQPKSLPLQAQPSVTSTAPKSPPMAPKTIPSKAPPPVAEKPTGNSFRDRIAAFNKTAAPPPAPFKPGGQATSSTGFIKKPFVALPPSKNAYVPPPREPPPQKIYRREEDPELSRDQAQDTEPKESTMGAQEPPSEEDQPKPTSLKERIALLQKQQLEQASRHAEASQKKEKPKKPVRKRTESSEDVNRPADIAEPQPERVDTNETVGKKSVDFADDEAGPLRGPRRQPSGHAAIRTPPPPARELMSDTNDADDSGAGDTEDALETSAEDDRREPDKIQASAYQRPKDDAAVADEGEDTEEAEAEEEEEDEDPEIRRRREIRDRMAKMSGGMGMMGMFGPPGGLPGTAPPRKPKPQAEPERQADGDDEMANAPPVPIMALPGMSNMRPIKPEKAPEPEDDEEDFAQHTQQEPEMKSASEDEEEAPPPPKRTSTDRAAPPVPQDRAVPPPLPRESRAAPPIPPSERSAPPLPPTSPARAVPPTPIITNPLTPSDETNKELSSPPLVGAARPQSKDGPSAVTGAPPVPPSRPSESTYHTASPPTSPTSEKRMARAPPPMPPMSPTTAASQSRAPPPPPPGQPPSRRSTANSHISMASSKHQVDNDSEDEVTEYDGDYDTDIASSAKHKDALKSHNRDSSLDDGLLGDEPSPASPPLRAVPPVPTSSVPRDLPPPPPQAVPKSRKSMDAPRAAPPPVPPPKEAFDNEYDPYNAYANASQHGAPSSVPRQVYAPALQSPKEELEADDMYEATAQATRAPAPPPVEQRGIPPPPTYPYPPAPTLVAEPPRESLDVRRSNTVGRRSMEQNRPGSAHGFIASDLDLGHNSMWWAQDKLPPPVLQNRSDVRYEIESSSSTKRGGKTTISKDVYILYMDYSQTTINVSFDPQEPAHVAMEQRHDRPPPPLRQDQLEDAAKQFSSRLAESASAKNNASVGDGSAQGFIYELIQSLPDALLPIGTRAYGALVYANLANASTQQFDEIRAGDIVSFRNAKFSGHKGGLHSKYSMEVGKPDHVGVVIDWDGTKKKIRAWEQGREGDGKGKKSKVQQESFRVGDLKSGEVRVWRVMSRKWVGWN